MLHLLVSTLLLISSNAFAAKPACTLAGLTDSCKAFEKYGKQPLIKLPDGTSFPNPLASPVQMMDPEQGAMGHEGHNHGPLPGVNQQEPNPVAALQIEDMRLQQKIMDVFEGLSSKKQLNSNFKTEFVSLIPPDQILLWAGKRLVYPPGTRQNKIDRVTMTWPPDDPQATRKSVAVVDIVKWMDQIPAPYKTQLRAIFNSRATIKVAYLNTPEGAMALSPTNAVPEATKKRITELYQYSVKALIDEVSKGRADADLSAAERAIVNRIKTVKFQISDPRAPGCQTMGQSPHYEPQLHKFTICAPAASWPNSTLIRTIAHEISHSFDPCSQTLPFFKLNRTELNKLSRSPSEWPDDLRKYPIVAGLLTQYLSQPDVDNAILDNQMIIGAPQARETLERLGIIELVDPGFSLNESPSKTTYTCLRDTGFKEIDDAALKEIADKLYTKLAENSDDPPDRAKFAELWKERTKTSAQCIRGVPGQPSHMGEVMADAWATKVLGKWLSKNPFKSEDEKLGFFLMESSAACSTNRKTALNNPSGIMLAGILDLTSASNDLHPPMRTRADQIVLTDTRVQAAFGCEPNPDRKCLTSIGTTGDMPKPGPRSIPTNKTEGTNK